MSKPTAVGNYIFAGGFTLGVARHFNVLAHVEDGMFGVNTFKLNFPHVPVYIDRDTWPASKFKGVDLVYCNPPCSPWSAAGGGMKGGGHWRVDPLTSCVRHASDFAAQVRPKIWIWESVIRAFTQGRELVDDLTNEWLQRGYSVTYWLNNLQHHGVAQTRKRFMLIAHKVDLKWRPIDTGFITVHDAIDKMRTSDLTFVNGMPEAWKPWLQHVREGDAVGETWMKLFPQRAKILSVRSNGKTYVAGRPHLMAHRVRRDRPCGVITSVVAQMHYRYNRWLGHEELLKLGGWPLDYKFAGRTGMWQSEIAKAVQPPAGEYIARVCAASIKAGIKIKRPMTQLIDTRGD